MLHFKLLKRVGKQAISSDIFLVLFGVILHQNKTLSMNAQASCKG